MTKCENCNKAELILNKKPQEIHCLVMDKSYIYGQRVNCPLNEEYNTTKGKEHGKDRN